MQKFTISLFIIASLLPFTISHLPEKSKNEAPAGFKQIAYINTLPTLFGPSLIDSFGVNSPCYNIIILTFWMPNWVSDALGIWQNIHSYIGSDIYGSNNAEIQKYILDTMHANGKQLFISAFGGTSLPSGDPEALAQQLANFVNENPYIDGVDIDYEDNYAVYNGYGIDFIIAFQKALSRLLNNKNLLFTHAPQAPYFSKYYYQDKGYYKVEKEIGDLIAWYNVQFYNQDTDSYDTYDNLFIQSPTPFINTAYLEIVNISKVPLSKLVLGKPASPSDVSNTGYINPSSLGEICLRAKQELGYELPGFFIWQYKNDQDCHFANSFINSQFPSSSEKNSHGHSYTQ